jgi:hypothetical protein
MENSSFSNLGIGRVGNVGETTGNWDNGFYSDCDLCGVSTQFLIDSGSTISLLAHRVYQNIMEKLRPVLDEETCDLRDINGSSCVILCQTEYWVKIFFFKTSRELITRSIFYTLTKTLYTVISGREPVWFVEC